MTVRPDLREILARLYPDYNDRWVVSFDDGPGISICRSMHDKNDDCEWEEVSLHAIEKAEREIIARERPIHLSHCYQGENEACKYGDEDCPAAPRMALPPLGGGVSPIEWLRSSAAMDEKKGASARAREANAIADWIENMATLKLLPRTKDAATAALVDEIAQLRTTVVNRRLARMRAMYPEIDDSPVIPLDADQIIELALKRELVHQRKVVADLEKESS